MAAWFTTWADLTQEEQNIYLEFNCPIVNNQREIPDNNTPIDPALMLVVPSEAMINAVCDTGDRLVRTINFRLTDGQRNAIVGWIEANLPNHPDPIAPNL
jgi:hypothetical protein